MGKNKLLRKLALVPCILLPREQARTWNRWLRGRHEYKKLRSADCAIVSHPKSGRTWLRVMMTRAYQLEYNVSNMKLLGFNNLQKQNSAIPRFCFTHDNYIKAYTRNTKSKTDFHGSKVVLLARDPRDVAVSSYFQRKYRPNPAKRGLRDIEVDGSNPPTMFEFVRYRVANIIEFLNAWQNDAPNMRDFLMVRYEDLKANPEATLKKILAFIGTPVSDEIAKEAVAFASYENLKKLEQAGTFGREDRRLTPGDPNNPDSFKVRRAKVGGYRDYFEATEVEMIDQMIASQLSPEFGYQAPREVAAGNAST